MKSDWKGSKEEVDWFGQPKTKILTYTWYLKSEMKSVQQNLMQDGEQFERQREEKRESVRKKTKVGPFLFLGFILTLLMFLLLSVGRKVC